MIKGQGKMQITICDVCGEKGCFAWIYDGDTRTKWDLCPTCKQQLVQLCVKNLKGTSVVDRSGKR